MDIRNAMARGGSAPRKPRGSVALQASGWLFLLYFVYAQCIPVFDYDLSVRMGTQEPASQATDVGVAYWWAFALGDLIIYLPLLAAG